MTYKEIEAKVKELKEMKVMMEELKDQIAALEDEVKAEMEAQKTDTLLAGPFKVTWKPYTSSRFDSNAFKATHAELYKQYSKKFTTKRFTVA